MDRHTLSSRLARIGDDLPRLSNTINAMAANTGTYGKNYEELSLDAARRAERIACSLRNLIYAADLVPKPVLMEAAAQVHGISIRHTQDIVEIAQAETPYFRMGGAVFTAAGRFSVKSLKNPICFFPCPPAPSAIRGSGFFP